MQYTYQDIFHYSKQFLNLSILMSFSASAIFCFVSFTMAKRFPLSIFIQGNNNNNKKPTQKEIR